MIMVMVKRRSCLSCPPPAEKYLEKYLEIDKTFNFGNFKALLKPYIMKKQLAILAFVGVLASSTLFAQDADPAPSASTSVTQAASEPGTEDMSFHEVLKDWFIQGGPTFMTPVLICLILGLAFSIERIITLN